MSCRNCDPTYQGTFCRCPKCGESCELDRHECDPLRLALVDGARMMIELYSAERLAAHQMFLAAYMEAISLLKKGIGE